MALARKTADRNKTEKTAENGGKRSVLEDACREAGGHRRTELLALRDEGRLPGTLAEQGLLHGAPAQASEDGLDTAPRARPIAAGPDVKRAGQALGALEQRIVGAVEEILQRAAHVAEVFGGAEDHRLRGQHVVGPGLQWRRHHNLDAGFA